MHELFYRCPVVVSLCLATMLPACDLLESGDDPADGGTGQAVGWTEPYEVVPGAAHPTALGQDLGSLYFAADTGVIQSAAKEGGDTTVITESLGFTSDLVADADGIYWLDETHGHVWSWDFAAAQAQVLAIGTQSPRRIALDASFVYWIDDSRSITRVARAGGYPELLAYGPYDLTDIAVTDERIYFTESTTGAVRSLPLVGGPVDVLASSQTGASSVAVDDKRVFWTTTTKVMALDVTDPEAERETLAEELASPDWLTAAGGYVYFTSAQDGAVMRVRKSGGNVETIAAGQPEPLNVVVDSSSVYWINHGDESHSGSLNAVTRR